MCFVRRGNRFDGSTLISWMLVLAVGLLPVGSHASGRLRLATQESAPYQTARDGRLGGLAVKVVQCVLAKLNQPYMIAEFPWRRAQMLVEAGVYDGFFAASRTPQRDRFAVLSEPIADQSWRWYWLAASKLNPESEAFKASGTVSALASSSMQFWLEQNGYHINSHATTTEQLFAQLMHGRVEAVLSNEAMARDYLKDSPALPGTLSEQPFTRLTVPELQMGVYFSREYLSRNPNFLAQFNRQIASCR